MKQVTIALVDEIGQPVNGTVSIYDINDDYNRVVQEQTLSGLITALALPEGSYLARIFSREATFAPKRFDILLADADNLYISCVGTSIALGIPSDSSLCRVFGKVVDACNNPIAGLEISFLLQSGRSNIGDMLQSIYGRTKTDADGNIDVLLNRNCYYIVTGIPHLNYVEEELPQGVGINVPDTGLAKIIDLIAPIPMIILPANIDTTAGSLSFLPDITMTDGKKLLQNINDYIQVVSDSLTVTVRSTQISIADIPIGVHTVLVYAKTFDPKEINTKGIIRRFGLSQPVGHITITAT